MMRPKPKLIEDRLRLPAGMDLLFCVIVAFAVVPYSTGMVMHFYQLGRFPIQPLVYTVAFGALCCVTAVKYRPRLTIEHIILLVLLTYRFLLALLTPIEPSVDPVEQIKLLGSALFFALTMCCLTGKATLMENYILVCAIPTLVIDIGLDCYEWFHPGAFSNVPGRASGWLENPNGSAVMITSMVGWLLTTLIPRYLSAGFVAASVLGVYLTLSRAGYILMAAIIVLFGWLCLRSKAIQSLGALACVAVAVFLVLRVIDFRTEYSAGDVLKRQTVLRSGEDILDTHDMRVALAEDAFDAILKRPISGYGPGYSEGVYTPHNQFLATWIDGGIVAISLFVTMMIFFVISCIRCGGRFWLGIVPVIGWIPFHHNMLEDRNFLFGFIIVSALAAHQKQKMAAVRRVKAINRREHQPAAARLDLAPKPQSA